MPKIRMYLVVRAGMHQGRCRVFSRCYSTHLRFARQMTSFQAEQHKTKILDDDGLFDLIETRSAEKRKEATSKAKDSGGSKAKHGGKANEVGGLSAELLRKLTINDVRGPGGIYGIS